MIIWLNGAFGAGKTTIAQELNRRLPNSFIYDPENVGYFIKHNTNGLFSEGDFQDIPLWREMNYKILKMIAVKYDGIVIVPMTLVNPVYYREIIEKIISEGFELHHYILYAKHDEIKRRLKKRMLPFIGNEDFAFNAIDRCIDFFDNHIRDVAINTENMSINNIVEKIADLSRLKLSRGRRTRWSELFYRLYISLKRV